MVIETYYLPATNTRGSRIVARNGITRRMILPWNDALNPEENHRGALEAFLDRYDVIGTFYPGTRPDGSHVWISTYRNPVTREETRNLSPWERSPL